VNTFVIDASVAVKWVIEEDGTSEALMLRRRTRLIAPELLVAECANILWKKVQRDELSNDQAFLAARLLQAADIEFLSTRSLLETATKLAIEFEHPAYDCLYLALAIERDCPFVTADERFVRKAGERRRRPHGRVVIGLAQAARELDKTTPSGPRSHR
jgi:predicted nucleic acid-binding protein